jgi:hypothetical protein
MVIGIVGSEAAKFTPETEATAREIITRLLTAPDVTGVSSGACHLGGIDVWAEELGRFWGLDLFIFPPRNLSWATGYKPRNLQIVAASDEVHCITLKELPPSYTGMRFPLCYHCGRNDHVKSGGCWTMKQARMAGKTVALWII